MAGLSKTTIDVVPFVAFTLASDGFTGSINIAQFSALSLQLVYTFGMGDTSAGTITLQISNNGTNWEDASGTSVAFTAASTGTIYGDAQFEFPVKWIRLKVDNTSGTGGTMTGYLHAEQPTG